MAISSTKARSLYRRLLRELPARSPSLLANPSPIQQHIRADFATDPSSRPESQKQNKHPTRRAEEAEQYVHYLRAQRMYTALLERYNPGINMNDEERLRLTARRVGMEMPVEMETNKGNK